MIHKAYWHIGAGNTAGFHTLSARLTVRWALLVQTSLIFIKASLKSWSAPSCLCWNTAKSASTADSSLISSACGTACLLSSTTVSSQREGQRCWGCRDAAGVSGSSVPRACSLGSSSLQWSPACWPPPVVSVPRTGKVVKRYQINPKACLGIK